MADGHTPYEEREDVTTITRLDGRLVILPKRAGHLCPICGMWVNVHACHFSGDKPPMQTVVELRLTAKSYSVDPAAERLVELLGRAADLLEERLR